MRYRRDYQETHDIDWFFRYRGKVYHAASNGGILPDKIDSQKNRTIQEKLEEMPGAHKAVMSEWTQTNRQGEDFQSFFEYVTKGFISLDRIEDHGERPRYQRIAFPLNGEMFDNVDILQLMPELNDSEIEIYE